MSNPNFFDLCLNQRKMLLNRVNKLCKGVNKWLSNLFTGKRELTWMQMMMTMITKMTIVDMDIREMDRVQDMAINNKTRMNNGKSNNVRAIKTHEYIKKCVN